jgi:hypothetical protein
MWFCTTKHANKHGGIIYRVASGKRAVPTAIHRQTTLERTTKQFWEELLADMQFITKLHLVWTT